MSAGATISGANTHNNLSRPGYPGIKGKTAQADGTTTTIVLAADESSDDDFFNGAYLELTAGTDSGDIVQIVDYNGTTKVATVSPNFTSGPSGDSVYTIYGISGIAQGGAASTVTLPSTASATDSIFVGAYVRLQAGPGERQQRRITAYNGTSKVATVEPAWDDSPTSSTTYSVFGEGGTAQAVTKNTITLAGTSLSSAAGFYNNMSVEVTSAGNSHARGQIRTISDFAATRVATVTPDWDPLPTGTVVYRIFPGWGGSYENVQSSSIFTVHTAVATGEYGIIETALAMTSTGYNASGNAVYNLRHNLWGRLKSDPQVGDFVHSFNVASQFGRVIIVPFGNAITGGLQVRHSIEQNALSSHAVSSFVGADSTCELVRAILTGKIGASDVFRNVGVSPQGELAVAIPKTAFGEVSNAELTPQIQMNFVSELDSQELFRTVVGTQTTIRHEVSQYFLRLGDSPITSGSMVPTVDIDDEATIVTKRVGRYRPGLGSVSRFTAVFNSNSDDNLWQSVGLASVSSALEFGYHLDSVSSTVKFGVNRATGGRIEVRTLYITTGAGVADDLTLRLPDFPSSPAPGGTKGGNTSRLYTVTLDGTESVQEVARKIAENATPTWATHKWDVQNIGDRVVFSSVGAGPRVDETYTFAAGGTGVAVTSVQRVQEAVPNVKPEVHELDITAAATSDGSVRVILQSGGDNDIALTSAVHDSAAKVAWAIVNTPGTAWASYGGGWTAEIASDNSTLIRFTATDNTARAGTYSFADFGGTGVTNSTFIRRRLGAVLTENWTFQEDWNRDRCDGTGPSRFLLNPQNGNVYQIAFQYLGFGGIQYFVENPRTRELIEVHVEEYAGTSASTHLENPHMPLRARIFAAGDAADAAYSMSTGSWAYFTEGPIKHIAPRFTADNYEAAVASGTEFLVLALKHPAVNIDGPSQNGMYIQSVIAGIDASANTVTTLYARLNPTFGAAEPNWKQVSFPDSPMLVADVATDGSAISTITVNGGTIIGASPSAGDAHYDFNLVDFELVSGDVLTFSVLSRSANVDIELAVTWFEDH